VKQATQAPSWMKTLLRALRQDGFSVAFLDKTTSLNSLSISRAQFILTYEIEGIAKLRQKYGTSKQYVLITSDFETISSKTADYLFPPSLNYIRRQLRAIMRLHDEKQSLTAEAAQLEKTFSKQRAGVEVLKNAIVRNVSHELKTPLLQVKAAVSLMAEDSQNEELTLYAKNAMARLEALVKNITLLGSASEAHPGPVIIRDVIDYAKRNISRSWQHNNAIQRIVIRCEDDLPPVLADKQGLSTVLQLLLDNALKFSEKHVEVIVNQCDNQVKISIRDYGIGINTSEIEAIFEMFYQVDASSTRAYGGTGIGLALVRLILDQHNTTIHVESHLGEGSTFSFLLPQVAL
jgi:two-component system phosphate regulon sensor histidine kinase PhoR